MLWRRAVRARGRLALQPLRRGRELPAGDGVAGITTPLLLTDPDRERRWPGQAQRLFDRLTGPKQLVRPAGDEGAALREARIFDWLDGYLT